MPSNLHIDQPERQRVRRTLVAVLAADMVAYSSQMSDDAIGTLARLKRLREELFGPLIAGHRGKLVKNMGDGWIVTFSSAVDAVTCAMRMQDKLVVEPDTELRMGIHMGDIVVENEDVFGDAVNVASRLQCLSSPGGLVISDAVFGGLDGTLKPGFDAGGEQELKNIPGPVKIWLRGGLVGAAETRARENGSGLPELSILPLEAPKDDQELREVAGSLAHDLDVYLSSSDWLDCSIRATPAKNAFQFSGRLRSSGARLRLETDLTAPDGSNISTWKCDGTRDDVFEWQDRTCETTTAQVFGALLDRISAELNAKSEGQMTAEDWAVKSVLVTQFDAESFLKGLHCVEKMIHLRPDWPYPYEWGSAFLTSASILQFKEITEKYASVRQSWLEKAMELTCGSSSSRAIIAFSKYAKYGDVQAAQRDLNAFLRDLPFNPEALMMAGYMSLFMGDPQTAMECFRSFRKVGRYHPFTVALGGGFGGAYLMMGRFKEAELELENAIILFPKYSGSYRFLAATLAQLGRLDEARATLGKMNELVSGVTISGVREAGRYVDTPGTRRYFDGLNLAGMPD
jgi:adenylate cyclase